MQTDKLITEVFTYAEEHYYDGWDVIVETFTREEMAQLIGRGTTLKGALKKAKLVVELFNERRNAAYNERW
jgi:hypothetical protein